MQVRRSIGSLPIYDSNVIEEDQVYGFQREEQSVSISPILHSLNLYNIKLINKFKSIIYYLHCLYFK